MLFADFTLAIMAESSDECIITFRDVLVKLINALDPRLAGCFKTEAVLQY